MKLALLALSSLVIGSAHAQGVEQVPPPSTGSAIGQVVVGDPITDPIRPHDVLKVTVVAAPYLSDSYPVDKDGYLFHPALRARIRVAGMSRIQASELVRKRIVELKLLKRVEVGVSYVSRKAREASIGGAVQVAIRQLLREGDHLSDVLGRAVPLAGADLARVTLTRGDKKVTVNYKRFTSGIEDGPTVNPRIEDGDRIFVPAAEIAGGNVRIRGEVKDTTKVVIPIIEGTTVGLILQSVGGITDLADKGGIYVQRGTERVAVPYDDIVKGVRDRDVKLLDKDEIIVPKLERPKQVMISGSGVLRPGPVMLTQGLNLSLALAQVGGFQPGIKKKLVRVERLSADGKSSTVVEHDLSKGGGATVLLQDGDIVTVDYTPQNGQNSLNNVLGIVGTLVGVLSLIRR
jgi:protein involved in polysaccharide export with SLBB domain